jgi:hypothetical protein
MDRKAAVDAEVGEHHLRRRAGRRRLRRIAVASGRWNGWRLVSSAMRDTLSIIRSSSLDFPDRHAGVDEAHVDRCLAAVADDRKQDIVALLRLAAALLDRLHARRECGLIRLQRRRRFGHPHLARRPSASGAPRTARAARRHDIHHLPHHRGQFGHVDEFCEARLGLVAAGGVLLQRGDRLAECAGPGVELARPRSSSSACCR